MRRAGTFFRVCKPDWIDCGDTQFSKANGGRWNVREQFGALYLNATVDVAAAQARHQHAGRAIGLFDLRPDRLPRLATFDVPAIEVVDVVSDRAVEALGLPASYPFDVPWAPCQCIAAAAYAAGAAGIAGRSAAEARPDYVVGEELARFDSQPPLTPRNLEPFESWYPDPFPRR